MPVHCIRRTLCRASKTCLVSDGTGPDAAAETAYRHLVGSCYKRPICSNARHTWCTKGRAWCAWTLCTLAFVCRQSQICTFPFSSATANCDGLMGSHMALEAASITCQNEAQPTHQDGCVVRHRGDCIEHMVLLPLIPISVSLMPHHTTGYLARIKKPIFWGQTHRFHTLFHPIRCRFSVGPQVPAFHS